MSITTGTIASQATWTLECTALRAVLESITGITLISDTGADNARVLLYSVLGTNKYMKLLYSATGYGRIDMLKVDNSTVLVSAAVSRMYFATEQPYAIAVNGNLTMFMLTPPAYTAYATLFMWTNNSASTKRFFIGSAGYLIHQTADTYIVNVFTAGLGYLPTMITKKTLAGEQLLYPVVMLADSTTYVDAVPLDNVYLFPNMDTLALYVQATINSIVYVHLWAGILIKTA